MDEAGTEGSARSALPTNARVVFARVVDHAYVVDVMRPDGGPVALVLRRPDAAMIDDVISTVLRVWAEASTAVTLRVRPGRKGVVAELSSRGPCGRSVRLDLVGVSGLSEPDGQLR